MSSLGSPSTSPTITSFVNGVCVEPGSAFWEIHAPFDGRVVRKASAGDSQLLESAITHAVAAKPAMKHLAGHERAGILNRLADLVAAHREEFARLLCEEAGKPVTLGEQEADRTVQTIRDAAHWAANPDDKMIPLSGSIYGTGRQGILKRFPVGVVGAITPFNFPLNLVAHKIAPAIAAGCPVVLKPASQTPSAALRLAALATQAGVPAGGINVVLLRGKDADQIVTDERIALVTFTGSAEVGWAIKSRCGKKKVALELGGNAGAIVEPDADLDHAAKRVAAGAFGYAGQSCISVQRVHVHESVADVFTGKLKQASESIPTGDPSLPSTICGPLIDTGNAARVSTWIDRALKRGGKLVTGNSRDGSVVSPTVLVDVPADCEVNCDEVFGPVVTLTTYTEFGQALKMLNDSRYGLQAGVFTNDWPRIWKAFCALDVGGVIHNDVPTFRVDQMPYGGIKDSGFGREGARWSIHEMTEPKLLVLSTQ